MTPYKSLDKYFGLEKAVFLERNTGPVEAVRGPFMGLFSLPILHAPIHRRFNVKRPEEKLTNFITRFYYSFPCMSINNNVGICVRSRLFLFTIQTSIHSQRFGGYEECVRN